MYEFSFFSQRFLNFIDPLLATAAIFYSIKNVEKYHILKQNNSNYNKTFFFLNLIGSIGIKILNDINDQNQNNDLVKLVDFSSNIMMLPAILNLWNCEKNAVSYGVYLGLTIGILPNYIAKITSDIANTINTYNRSNNDVFTDNEEVFLYKNSYSYSSFKGFTPAFVRGIVFFELNKVMPTIFAAFIGGSIRSYMLDNSASMMSMIFSISVDGLNAAVNRLETFKIFTPIDKIFPDSSTMIAIEFIEYFVRNFHDKHSSTSDHLAEKVKNIVDNKNIYDESFHDTNSSVIIVNKETFDEL